VEIEDSGPGVAPELAERVFEPYFRAPGLTQQGLGLGLATVERMVVAHGGRVGVRRGAIGALFWFELPVAPGREVGGHEGAAQQEGPTEAPTMH